MIRFLLMTLLTAAVHLSMFADAASAEGADTYRIRLDPSVRSEPATGRIVLFVITETRRPYDRVMPMDAPFYGKPQPIASIAVENFKPGDTAIIDGSTHAWPASLDTLDGPIRVQAVLDTDQISRSHDQGVGNVYSEVYEVVVSAEREDVIDITLSKRIDARPPRPEDDLLKWVELRSEMLSAWYGFDVHHRAGVALPVKFNDAKHPRQRWPAVYVIPGFGGRDEGAVEYAAMLQTDDIEDIAPIAVYIVLDADAPLGHHGFVDSENNGPRAKALITEFIPYLEQRFRLVPESKARIVTGHSSGGWSSLWLALTQPETFGACWSSAPDPVDFSAFQMTDIYAEPNLFVQADGSESPSYRGYASREGPTVLMTARQEAGMEHAIDPDGRSGQQWDAWEAMFGPRHSTSRFPVPMFNAITGEIDRNVVEHWKKFDIARLIASDWSKYGPIMLNNVRLVCGEEDSYYLNRAVERLKAKVDALRDQHDTPVGDGYILMVPDADHSSISRKTFERWNQEMRAYLAKHGLMP